MKILGLILTIGGFLSFCVLIEEIANGGDRFYLPAALFAVALLVVGLVILKKSPKKFNEGDANQYLKNNYFVWGGAIENE